MVTHVFNRQKIFASRLNAAKHAKAHAFLHQAALENIKSRLMDVRRDFGNVLIIGAFFGAQELAQWLRANKNAKTVIIMDAALKADLRGDEEALPLAYQSLDLVIGAGTLHGVNDLPGALVQIRRALRPDGLFMGVMAGGETLWELRDILMRTSDALHEGFAPRLHPLVSLQVMAGLLQRAGFTLPVADSEVTRVSYRSLKTLLKDLKGMGEGLALAQEGDAPKRSAYPGRGFWAQAQTLYRRDHADKDGHLEASFELLYALGWAPHESQPKPLERGTATMRLEDALNNKPEA